MNVKIDGAGRIVVPKDVRERLGLSAGTELDLAVFDDRIELSVEHPRARVELRDGLPVIVAPDGAPAMTDDDVRALLEEGRDERARRILAELS
jgi:AbrB family looped-hinge helix DNA binding protein